MKLTNRKTIVSTFLAGTILGASATAAFAGTAVGISRTDGPYNGYTYSSESSVSSYSGKVRATTSMSNVAETTVPTGYMGISAILYSDSNKTIQLKNFVYNPSPAVGVGYSTDEFTISGAFYSQGYCKAYGSDGNYSVWETYASPKVNN